MGTDDMLQKLEAMQARFVSKLPGRLAAIDATLQDCRDQPGRREHLEELHRLLHSMRGAAGTFGYDALGRQAGAFEHEVEAWLAAGVWSERDLNRLALQLPQLRAHIDHAPLDMGTRSAPQKSNSDNSSR